MMIKQIAINMALFFSTVGLAFATNLPLNKAEMGYLVKEKGAVVVRRGIVRAPVVRSTPVVVAPKAVIVNPVVVPRAIVRQPVVVTPRVGAVRRW